MDKEKAKGIKEKVKGKPVLLPMDTQVQFNECTNPEDMKRAIDEVPEMKRGTGYWPCNTRSA